MIKNEKQYKSAKAKLEKWLQNLYVVESTEVVKQPAWVVREQKFAIDEQIKQLQEEIEEYEDLTLGRKSLPDPIVLVDQIPHLLIEWRIAHRLTQKELAELAGIHENLLQKYEAENYSGAAWHTVRHIAVVLIREHDRGKCSDKIAPLASYFTSMEGPPRKSSVKKRK